jgi:hypothetical protein
MASWRRVAGSFLVLLTLSCTTPGMSPEQTDNTGTTGTTTPRPNPGSVRNGGACEANADCAGRLVCLFGMCQP